MTAASRGARDGAHETGRQEAQVAVIAREPKHFVVRQHLLELIDMMEPGTAVPTERSLATQLHTSRTTVRHAVMDLVFEGRLVRRQGSGTFVADAKITWPLHLASFTEQARANGMVATSRLLHTAREKADAQVAQRLAIAIGDPVYRIERLRLAGDLPTAVEASLLSANRFPGLTRAMRSAGSLHELLREQFGVVPRSGEETIDIAPASPGQAQLLQIDTSAPLLVVRRHSFDQDRRPVEWASSWFRGDRITFVASLSDPGKAS